LKKLNFDLALITGATSGLGKELARQLAKEKISLFLTGRNESELNTLKEELSSLTTVTIFPCDLTNPQERKHLTSEIYEKAPDLVINNAGSGLYGPALSYPTKDQLKTFELNLNAPVEITLDAARALQSKAKPGTILNISSIAAYFTFPNFAAYASSKVALKNFSKSLDSELEGSGIRSLVSCPGRIHTDFARRASQGKFTPSPKDAMEVSYAAKSVLNQIAKGKGNNIFGPRYFFFVLITRFVPEKIMNKIFKKKLSQRTQDQHLQK